MVKRQSSILVFVILAFFIGSQGMTLLPFWMGASIDTFGLSHQQGGWLATTQLGAATLLTLICSAKIDRMDRIKLVFIGLIFSFMGNAYCAILSNTVDLTLLFGARLITGVGEGIVLAGVSAVAANSDRPVRMFAFMNSGMALLTAALFLLTPPLVEQYGVQALFATMAASSILVMLIVLVSRSTLNEIAYLASRDQKTVPTGKLQPSHYLALIFFGFLACAFGGVWSNVERIGISSVGLELDFVGQIIAVGAVLFIIGPWIANKIAWSFGTFLPLLMAVLAYVVVSFLFAFTTNVEFFALAVAGHTITAGFSVTFLSALFARIDSTGRVAAASPAFNSVGNAIGPTLVAMSLPVFSGYVAIAWISASLLLVVIIGYAYIIFRSKLL